MKLDETFLILDRAPPLAAPDHVRMTKLQPHSYVAGPGRRCVLWVAGCNRRCPGCFQPHFFDFRAGKPMPIEMLAEQIVSIRGIEGLSISGGEPFEQSDPLAKLCQTLRQRSNLNILAYSGYTLESLQAISAAHRRLLDQLDWLIDGEYREAERGPYLWRGSANQRIHHLASNPSASGSSAESDFNRDPVSESIQVVVENDRIVVGGFPGPKLESDLRQSLASRGILLSPENTVDKSQ